MFEMNALGTDDISADNIKYKHLYSYLQLFFERIIYWQCAVTSWLLINDEKLKICVDNGRGGSTNTSSGLET